MTKLFAVGLLIGSCVLGSFVSRAVSAQLPAAGVPPWLVVGVCYRVDGLTPVERVYEIQGTWVRVSPTNPVAQMWRNVAVAPQLTMMINDINCKVL